MAINEWMSAMQMPTDACDFELDKIPGFWVVTCWPGPDVVLRLRICYVSDTEPCDLFCEIRMGAGMDFSVIGQLESTMYELHDANWHWTLTEFGNPMEGLPSNVRPIFTEMARRFARCTDLLTFGQSLWRPRYGDEPASSHDCYEAQDDSTAS